MTLYQLALFLHVLSGFVLFATLGMEWSAASLLDSSDARPRLRQLAAGSRVAGPAAGGVMITGIYMAITVWGHQVWIDLGFLSLLVIAGLAVRVTDRRVTAALRDPDPEAWTRMRDAWFTLSLRLRTTLAIGIVMLMTVKPAPTLAVIATSVALLAGVAWSAPAFSRVATTTVDRSTS